MLAKSCRGRVRALQQTITSSSSTSPLRPIGAIRCDAADLPDGMGRRSWAHRQITRYQARVAHRGMAIASSCCVQTAAAAAAAARLHARLPIRAPPLQLARGAHVLCGVLLRHEAAQCKVHPGDHRVAELALVAYAIRPEKVEAPICSKGESGWCGWWMVREAHGLEVHAMCAELCVCGLCAAITHSGAAPSCGSRAPPV